MRRELKVTQEKELADRLNGFFDWYIDNYERLAIECFFGDDFFKNPSIVVKERNNAHTISVS